MVFWGVPPFPFSGVGFLGVVLALLPCSLLLRVFASAMVCSVASVTERALSIFVANGLSGSKTDWRVAVTISKAFFAVATLVISICAVESRVLRLANCRFAFDGL